MSERVPDSASEQEADWIRQIADGDRRAFEELYEVYGPRIFRFAIRMVREETKAEEVVNDVMFEVWKSAGRYEARSKPSTWILGIARFRALNAIRGKKIETQELDDATPIVDPSEDAGELLDRHSQIERVKEALTQLSPEHREVVELTYFQGCSYKEIAEIAGCPEGTVKTRMYHAKRRLEPLLAAEAAGGSP
ncbi:MAG: RNA polymerase subunit sigma [Deltaproteobacteria bacterium]|jgi:RNA polymerase sigma-70 factor (ECF subfamily)|nr:RNA polymerase subunit sigma [Deltaproteobacteria bacterium]